MNAMLGILGLGGGELVLVLVVILVLFGAKRIPEFAKGLGKGINEFKKASRDVTEAIESEPVTPPPRPVITPVITPVNTTPQATVTTVQPVKPAVPETKVV